MKMNKGRKYAEETRLLKPKGESAWGLNLIMLIVCGLLFTWAIASASNDGLWLQWLFSGVFGLMTILFLVMITKGDTR
jgi:multisubunit Na+/H+ antiporter MnhB subunit